MTDDSSSDASAGTSNAGGIGHAPHATHPFPALIPAAGHAAPATGTGQSGGGWLEENKQAEDEEEEEEDQELEGRRIPETNGSYPRAAPRRCSSCATPGSSVRPSGSHGGGGGGGGNDGTPPPDSTSPLLMPAEELPDVFHLFVRPRLVRTDGYRSPRHKLIFCSRN